LPNYSKTSKTLSPFAEERLNDYYQKLLLETILTNKYIKMIPNQKQTQFLLRLDPEGLYGGAAAGGKTIALLMGALMFAPVPGYAALLIRKDMKRLQQPGGILFRAHEWLRGSDAKWDYQNCRYVFPSNSTLNFGYLNDINDVYRYLSGEYQYIGIDEITENREKDYELLNGRLRRPITLDIPLRMRSATNPGGPGHAWVKRRFIDPKTRRLDAFFIPAFIEDNPGVDLATYEVSLSKMSYLSYERYRKGNWEIEEAGNCFKRGWFVYVNQNEIPLEMDAVVRYWDLAAGKPSRDTRDRDWTVGALVGVKNGIYYLMDIVRVQATPAEIENIIGGTAKRDGRAVMIFMEQEPGSQGAHLISYYQLNILFGYSFRGNHPTGSKISRADPVSALVNQGNLKVLNARWTSELVDEMVVFPDGFHDDQVDAVSGAVEMLAIYGRRPTGRRGVVT